jgi:hypothetical protein
MRCEKINPVTIKTAILPKKTARTSSLPSLSNENAKKVWIRANNPQPHTWNIQYLVFLDIVGINISSKVKELPGPALTLLISGK